MSEMLTEAEREVAERTEASIRALREDSHRRLEAEAVDERISRRRLHNVLLAYDEQHART